MLEYKYICGKAVFITEQSDMLFKGFLRLVYDDLTEIKEEKDSEKQQKKIDKLHNIIRRTLED